MRIKGVQLAGLAVALVGVAAEDALAADVSISTATTAPVTTASPDGVSPGTVTVTSTGSITIAAGQTAVTLNSNNSVINGGTIASNNVNNVTGIAVSGARTGDITVNGAINLLEDYTIIDIAPTDGDLDGEWQTGLNRNGVLLQAGSTLTGNIVTTTAGSLNVEGLDSAGIRLDGVLNGNLTHAGAITMFGDNARGIGINGGVTGNVVMTGGISLRGEGAVGINADAPITGELSVNGTINVSGYHALTHPTSQTVIDALDADDLLQSGSAVAVHYNVTGGVTIEGTGVEDDLDDDGDGVTETTGDANDDQTASINAYTSAPAVWIAPSATAPVNLTLGANAGYGFRNRGVITALGVYDGFTATALRIEGTGAATTTVTGGVLNDGGLSATAYEAESYGAYIGAGATVPTFNTRAVVSSRSVSEDAHNAYGVYFASGATVNSLNNSGSMTAQLFGEEGDAIAIRDASNTLATITNSGVIQAQVVATDSDITDNVIPVATGHGIAIDVSSSTIGVTVNQVADTVFNDDDTVDNDVNSRPPTRIVGEIRFGSGADTLNVAKGDVLGAISFGAGADTFILDNGAQYLGRVTDTDGALTINVIDGKLGLTGGTLNITSAHFGEDSDLGVVLSTDTALTTRIIASGSVTFDDGAVITPRIPQGLPDTGAHIFLTANGGLINGDAVERTLTGAGAPWIYDTKVEIVPTDANSLQASYTLKSASALGLDVNEAVAFNPILTALRTDDEASFAFANLVDETSFLDAYQDLLPNYASAAAELAATAIQQGQSASSNRLSTTRLRDIDEVSVWAQEIGYGLEREPESFGVKYRGSGFGVAGGIDGPLDNGGILGISASFIASEVEEPGRVDGEISAAVGSLNAYLGTAMGPIDLDIVAGAGVGQMRSRRFVQIGTFETQSEAEWWAYEGHGSIRASAPMRAGWLITTPQVALSYVALAEQGYTEAGGGTAVDYEVDDTVSQRLWGDAGVEFGGRFRMGAETQIAPRIFLGYRANLIDEAAERTVRFVSGGGDFTLADETLGDGGPLVGIGFDATNGFSTFTLGYEGELGDQLQRHSVNASLRFRF
ncbi:MAG: autotransporter domain-containing protein [Terricaulis sp.]